MAVKKPRMKGGKRLMTDDVVMKPLLVDVPETLRRDLKMYAVAHDTTIKDFVVEVLTAALAKKGGEKK